MTLLEKNKEFKKQYKEFRRISRELLKGPELEVHDLAVDMRIYDLREEIMKEIDKKRKQLTELYAKIYDGEPKTKEIDKYIEISEELIKCDDFIQPDLLQTLKVSRDLVWAFKHAQEQKSII